MTKLFKVELSTGFTWHGLTEREAKIHKEVAESEGIKATITLEGD